MTKYLLELDFKEQVQGVKYEVLSGPTFNNLDKDGEPVYIIKVKKIE